MGGRRRGARRRHGVGGSVVGQRPRCATPRPRRSVRGPPACHRRGPHLDEPGASVVVEGRFSDLETLRDPADDRGLQDRPDRGTRHALLNAGDNRRLHTETPRKVSRGPPELTPRGRDQRTQRRKSLPDWGADTSAPSSRHAPSINRRQRPLRAVYRRSSRARLERAAAPLEKRGDLLLQRSSAMRDLGGATARPGRSGRPDRGVTPTRVALRARVRQRRPPLAKDPLTCQEIRDRHRVIAIQRHPKLRVPPPRVQNPSRAQQLHHLRVYVHGNSL